MRGCWGLHWRIIAVSLCLFFICNKSVSIIHPVFLVQLSSVTKWTAHVTHAEGQKAEYCHIMFRVVTWPWTTRYSSGNFFSSIIYWLFCTELLVPALRQSIYSPGQASFIEELLQNWHSEICKTCAQFEQVCDARSFVVFIFTKRKKNK